ncbi:hypothetical protein HNR24_000185 [Nesterenkonia jeotgali]|uniref:Uncharacterized protein n=2 Tax=Nesterenkonia TaxID=57494 RepID=A0A839FPE2_9MICC|nr:hypothetical protein [Nesterenkonia jeotgali]NYJ15549.1 hypothetical protein [Nesterenkonia sandarakina]
MVTGATLQWVGSVTAVAERLHHDVNEETIQWHLNQSS